MAHYLEPLLRPGIPAEWEAQPTDVPSDWKDYPHLEALMLLEESMSLRRGAVKAMKAAGIFTVVTLRHPISRHTSDAVELGPLASCSGDVNSWCNGSSPSTIEVCPKGQENARRHGQMTQQIWDEWLQASQLGCPLVGTQIVHKDCINGTDSTNVGGERCRSEQLRWPRAMYQDNYFVRRLMGDPGCAAVTTPIKIQPYSTEDKAYSQVSSAYYGDQQSLLCETCVGCKCAMRLTIGQDELEQAKRVLDDIDIVLVDEERMMGRNQFDLHFPTPQMRRITKSAFAEAELFGHTRDPPARKDFPQLFEREKFDIELWEYAKQLTRKREERAQRVLRLQGQQAQEGNKPP